MQLMGMDAEVLIVDDDPLVREDVLASIESAGLECKCAQASNGEDAQEVLNIERAVRLIITDLVMPKMDGLTLTAWIKRELPHIKVILRSGTIAKGQRIAATEAGADAVLDKTARPAELIAEIRKALQRS